MVLCQVFDPLTGVYVWSTEPPSLRTSINDLHTDMLVDHGRNRSYDEAIGKAIWLKLSQLPADQGTLQVLDIGTGTGLLSLMAARHACRWFAAHSASSASIRVKITGCEIVGAMAQLAQAIVQRNRHLFEIYPIEIQILNLASTELSVGHEALQHPADLVISEILDSNLLDEAILPAFWHAKQNLTAPNAIFIPESARVHGQLFSSTTLLSFKDLRLSSHDLAPCYGPSCPSTLPCTMQTKVRDIARSDIEDIFRIDFTAKPGNDETMVEFRANEAMHGVDGVHGVMVWWTVSLFDGITINTSPYDPENHVREHWKPCVYFFKEHVRPGRRLCVPFYHNDMDIWHCRPERPVCECAWHMLFPPRFIATFLQQECLDQYQTAITQVLSAEPAKNWTIIDINDGSYLTEQLSQSPPKQVHRWISLEESSHFKSFFQPRNPNGVTFTSKLRPCRIDDILVIATPFFCVLEKEYVWIHIPRFMDRLNRIRCCAPSSLSVIPKRIHVVGQLISSDHLSRFHVPVKTVCGFDYRDYDMGLFHGMDELRCDEECVEWDSGVSSWDTVSLWMYHHEMLGQPQRVFSIDTSEPLREDSRSTATSEFEIRRGGNDVWCHGIAIWLEIEVMDGYFVSNGPTSLSSQTVVFFKRPVRYGTGEDMVCVMETIRKTALSGTIKFCRRT